MALLSFSKLSNIIQFSSRFCCHSAYKSNLIFRQLFEPVSSTYTYLLADNNNHEGILIDPVYETVERDEQLIKDLDINLKFILNTHVHADHITGSGKLKTLFPTSKSVISSYSKAKVDIAVSHNDVVKFGNFKIICRHTPGHTDGCLTYLFEEMGMAFTGDALLIRGCGRTDFQQGDAGKLYDVVHKYILSLPLHFLLYPAHDYTGRMVTTVEEELKHNTRLTKSRDEFIEIMKNLNLAYPKQIDKAVPANMICGVF